MARVLLWKCPRCERYFAEVEVISTSTPGSSSTPPMQVRVGRSRSPSQAFHASFMAGFNLMSVR